MKMMETQVEALTKALQGIVGTGNVSSEEPVVWSYTTDASLMGPPGGAPPDVVVRPRTTEEISSIVHLANLRRVSVIPSGGRTSLMGAGYSVRGGGILIDMGRMNKIRVHKDKALVTVEAGCTWGRLNYELNKEGLWLGQAGPTPGYSAQIGGSLSVGAFSILGSAKIGSCPELVTGLEVVLPNGDVVRTGAGANPANEMVARYCNGGDFAGIFLASHGTLGVITKATLKCFPQPEASAAVNVVFDDYDKNQDAIIKIQRTGYADILMNQNWTSFAILGVKPPPMVACCVSVSGNKDEIKYREESVTKILHECGGRDFTDEEKKLVFPTLDAADMRKTQHNSANPYRWAEFAGYIPNYRNAEFFKAVDELLRENMPLMQKYGLVPWIGTLPTPFCSNFWGLIMVPPPYTEEKGTMAKQICHDIADRLISMGQSPYWIGTALFEPLYWRLGPYFSLFKTIKKALDPNGIMNPGMLESLA
jgi:FAD/FMN-containing dehydrogenase